MVSRGRVIALVAVLLATALGAGGYVLYSRHRQAAATPVPTRSDMPSGSFVAFRSTALGNGYGEVALVPVDAADGARAFTGVQCDRVYATPGRGICLSADRGIVTTYGSEVRAADKNLWGVTFLDADTFFATASSGGTTWLVRGSLAARTVTAVREDVECPSLSPDGTRIAFKKHGDLPVGQWRLAVYDIATGNETVLAETRSVDDQAEWLDDKTVLYGLPRSGSSVATSDVWAVPADGSGAPKVFIHDAWSPAVVRP